jgi:hypothetical protein
MKPARILAAAILVAGIMTGLRAEERKKTPPQKPAPQKATAAQLASDAERAIAFMAREVKDSQDKSINLDNIRQQPFFSALRKTEEVVVKIQEQLDSHDVSFFETVNEGTQAVAELKSALPRSGIKNAKINEGVKVLSNTLTLLRRNYGREAVHRKRATKELDDNEKEQFTQLKESEKKLVTELEMLASEVKANNHLSAELARMISQLKKSIDAPMTTEAMDASLELFDVIEGEWEAYSYYVDPKNREAWAQARDAESFKAIEELSEKKNKEVAMEDWEFMDESIEFPAAVDVTVEIEVDEVEGYILFVEDSVEGVEVTVYYEDLDDEEGDEEQMEEAYAEFQDDVEMQRAVQPGQDEEPEQPQQ